MPPSSRGFIFLRFIRFYSQRSKFTLPSLKDVRAKTPQINRSPPVAEATEPLLAPKIEKRSQWELLLERISPRTRRRIARAIIIAPPLALFIIHFPIWIMPVNGPSMSPFLNPNSSSDSPATRDSILIQRMSFPERNGSGTDRPDLRLQRGQIIVFRTPHDPEKIAVKRVVALAGDRVQPLPGYPGGDDPVIVPYHHIWVEGDVDDRKKSIDSNWYGPITQNLVLGKVNMVLTPWYSPSLVRWEQHTYPAKASERVEHDVVGELNLHPDATSVQDYFISGIAEGDLEMMRRNRVKFPHLLAREDKRTIAARSYAAAKAEFSRGDPATVGIAGALVKEFELAFSAAGLTPAGDVRRVAPTAIAKADSADGDEKAGPARQALMEYLEKQKREREQESSHMDERMQGWAQQAKQMQETADQARQKTANNHPTT